tara:strand:+ start:839 stop:1375 length:537 start_codon:yes stop_codon:yes gene_type:complete
MKYAITGHTEGLGAELKKQLESDNLVVGVSRTTGYDIRLPEHRSRIIADTHDCDIFINNAHSSYGQTQLLYELWEHWKDTPRLIVNIGSNTSDGIKSHAHEYTAQKTALDKANEQLAYLNHACRVTMFKFGYLGTEKILNNYSPPEFIELTTAAKIIISNLSHPARLITMTILPQKKD